MSMRAHGMRVAVLAGLWLFVTTAVSAQSLNSVEIRGVGDGTRIVLDVDGEVSHKSFTLEKPDRVVVDLVGARNTVNGAPRGVPGGPVKQIRVAQFASDPQPITRIVADLRQPSTFQVERVGGKLVLAVTPKGSRMPQMASASTQPAAKGSAAPTSARREDTAAKPRVVTTSRTQAQGSTADQTTVTPKPTATAPTPAPATATKTATNTTTSARHLPAANDTQASTSAGDTPASSEKTSTSSVRRLPSGNATASNSTQDATAPSKTATPVKATSAQSTPPTAPRAAVSPTQTTRTEAKLPAGSLAPKARQVEESQTEQATAPKTSAATRAQTKPSASYQPTRWRSDALATREDLAPDPQPIMMQQRPGRRVNLDLQGADIRTVLRTLSDYAGVNIIASKEVQGEVSARIKDAPWRDALESVLKAHGFGAVEENGIIRVGEIDKIRMEDLEEKAAERKRDDLLPIVTSVVRLQFASAPELQNSLREMNSSRGKIQVDERTNSLIVSDIPRVVTQIAEMATELDGRTPQVEIVSKLVDISADDALNLGITWNGTYTKDDISGEATVSVPNVNPAGTFRVGTVQSWGQVDFMLDMLARERRANIVSNPNITTVDNREAKILVGSKIPLIVADEAGNAITQLTTVGIQMRVTPHVNSDKTITLDMHPEVSELSQQATVQGGVIINTSEADTRVIVEDGETAVIGGLIRNIDSEIQTGIPILMDIPGLGWMFRNTNKNKDKRELIIFVTPRLIGADVSLGGADAGDEDSQ